jgi:hypothetical protein
MRSSSKKDKKKIKNLFGDFLLKNEGSNKKPQSNTPRFNPNPNAIPRPNTNPSNGRNPHGIPNPNRNAYPHSNMNPNTQPSRKRKPEKRGDLPRATQVKKDLFNGLLFNKPDAQSEKKNRNNLYRHMNANPQHEPILEPDELCFRKRKDAKVLRYEKFHFMDQDSKKYRRQYICHSRNFNYLIAYPGDNFIGVLLYDLRSDIYIGKSN